MVAQRRFLLSAWALVVAACGGGGTQPPVNGSITVTVGSHSTIQLDETPSWFPDGKRLAIQSDRDGDWSVYVIDTAGATAVRLTQ